MSNSLSSSHILVAGLHKLGLEVSPEPFMHFLSLLEKLNSAYNLTAITAIDSMITKHLLDSLAILPLLRGARILDVGTGAGLPGIPLALALPTVNFTLLDSNGKKTRFLHEVKRILNLANVDIVQSRAETYHPEMTFDTIITRAFSDLTQMINWTKHLVHQPGQWLAMKGRYPQDELSTLNLPYQVKHYEVPGIEGERCCVIINNLG